MPTHPGLLPPNATAYRIANARVPSEFVAAPAAGGEGGFSPVDLIVDQGRIAKISHDGAPRNAGGIPVVDLQGGLIFPRFVDAHTHIDKGHIAPRAPNPDGTHTSARMTVAADRQRNWHADDVRRRMDFSLRCAYAHGTGTLRTHIDSMAPQADISWPVFAETREAWRERIALQAVALFPVPLALDDESQFRALTATVVRHGGVMGGLTFLGEPPDDKLAAAIDRVVAAAAAHGLDLDFHVDESNSPYARTLELVADAALRHRFSGKILAGHCCSLSLMEGADSARVMAKLGEARITVVSLPMCNMYLQDRRHDRTPRWRGVAPLHELDAIGVDVLVASDNTRDPFYAYGDLDMLEVWREATRILHLDHSSRPWKRLLGPAPARAIGEPEAGLIAVGRSADLVLTRARDAIELVARPQADRAVIVRGVPIDTTLPDYRELDPLMGRT
jgi:cytosine deaminase